MTVEELREKAKVLAEATGRSEEDILEDIRLKLIKYKIDFPDYILWIRPTTPLRDLSAFNKAYKIFQQTNKAVCIVSRSEPRIFYDSKNFLKPFLKIFKNQSMVRRQDCPIVYKIFYGEFFYFPHKKNKKFLGDKIKFIEQNFKCDFDLDFDYQFQTFENIIKNNKKKYEKFLHKY